MNRLHSAEDQAHADIARDRIERFVRRFGEPYRRLAWHAALPLILTPELLGYLRLHFLHGADGVAWIGEADLLLSDLCRPIGYEQFAFDQHIRAQLLADMREQCGDQPLIATARLLLSYLRQPGAASGLAHAQLQSEQWSAMAYLAEHRDQAARQISAAFRDGLGRGGVGTATEWVNGGISAAELARLVRLTNGLAEPLAAHGELLDYASTVASLLQDQHALRALANRPADQALAEREVEGVLLPDLAATQSGTKQHKPGDDGTAARAAEHIQGLHDTFSDGSNAPPMVWLPGGEFTMGQADGPYGDEKPAHRVRVGAFSIGQTPLTFADYDRFCDTTGRKKPGDEGWGRGQRPVINISWDDAQAYCKWISEQTGEHYRLLTEAEWEYACRAGSSSHWSFGGDEADLGNHGWYSKNAGGRTHPVAGKKANAWGLHDMHGNVREWCYDWFADDYYQQCVTSAEQSGAGLTENPSGPESGSSRVFRGGSWGNDAGHCRSAYRIWNGPSGRGDFLGFRLSRTGPWHSYPVTLGSDAVQSQPERAPAAAQPATPQPFERFRDQFVIVGKDGSERPMSAPEMVRLPAGEFMMGDERGQDREKPVHRARLDAFAIGRTAVTWGEYRRFCEATDGHWPEWLERGSEYYLKTGKNDHYSRCGVQRDVYTLPVVGIAWGDAMAYCDWLSECSGEQYQLPTEAQWEYACRAGTETRWSFGDDEKALGEHSWYSGNADGRLHPVAQKTKNPWGLYDMHGNVWEWCSDRYDPDYYKQYASRVEQSAVAASSKPVTVENPSGPESGSYRVIRGGSWLDVAGGCRSAYRYWRVPSVRDYGLGFRLSRIV